MKFFTDIPLKWTLYPLFHPNRPRFFNMATFYTAALYGIYMDVTGRLTNNDLSKFSSVEDMAYKSYVEWEENGGVDLQLPAFKLTNRQMFWLCVAHTTASKFHRKSLKASEGLQIVSEYLHIHLKQMPGFRQAFHCNELGIAEAAQQTEWATKLVNQHKWILKTLGFKT